MIVEYRVVGREVVNQHHETAIGLFVKLNSHQRGAISKHRRIPGETEFMRALNLQVVAAVNNDAAIFFPQIKAKSAADYGVQLDVNNIGIAGAHPAPEAVRIKPHVEDFFG